jgi:hypothetical protein
VIAALLFAAIAALLDWRTARVPNALTYGAALVGILLGGPLSFIAWFACAATLPLLRPSWVVGGGDVKALGALGALSPVLGVATAFAVAFSPVPCLSWRMCPAAFWWTTAFAFCLELR